LPLAPLPKTGLTKKINSVLKIHFSGVSMIPILLVVLFLLCVGLIHRYRAQERQRERSLMKRHATDYQAVHKSPW
jgi:hypothetical protein